MFSYTPLFFNITFSKAYEDGAEALKALNDYGCLHFKTDVILGVSPPRYSEEKLEQIHKKTTELIEYDGRKKTLYEWKQTQRAFERNVRTERQKADMYETAGLKRKAQEKHGDIISRCVGCSRGIHIRCGGYVFGDCGR